MHHQMKKTPLTSSNVYPSRSREEAVSHFLDLLSSVTISGSKRPDGATLLPWSRGKPLAWDVTVPDTFATSHIASTSYLPGVAAEHAATLKQQKYAALSQTQEVVPLAIETSGAFNSEGLEFVKKIGSRISHASSDEKETAYLLQRISVAIQRGNSISFSGYFEQCDNKWEPAPMRGF